jgi:hypothetical protein
MWVFTQTGFVSAVRKADAPSKITVRSRDKQSLEVLAELSETEIIETTSTRSGSRQPSTCLTMTTSRTAFLNHVDTCSTMP